MKHLVATILFSTAIASSSVAASEVLLGKIRVGDVKVEKTLYPSSAAKFDAVKLVVRRAPTEIHELEVNFCNGEDREAEKFRDVIRNGETRWIRFDRPRCIANIEIEADTEGETGRAVLFVIGNRVF